jgi:hypothetical protein
MKTSLNKLLFRLHFFAGLKQNLVVYGSWQIHMLCTINPSKQNCNSYLEVFDVMWWEATLAHFGPPMKLPLSEQSGGLTAATTVVKNASLN